MDLSQGRWRAVLATIIAFVIATLAGLWLANRASDPNVATGEIVLVAVGIFVVVAPLLLYAIYIYVSTQNMDDDMPRDEMHKVRDMLDIMRLEREMPLNDLANSLDTSPESVLMMLRELEDLDLPTLQYEPDTRLIRFPTP